ncbi:MAG: metal ABC transporter ATP-binding protein [Pseudomonadota bacterium]
MNHPSPLHPCVGEAGDVLIEARDLDVRLGGRTVLSDVSLAIAPGEIVTLVGPNGSGKSTLLRALLGAVPVGAGRVRRKRGLRIGYVPQRLHVDASMPLTVRRFLDLPEQRGATAAAEALAAVGLEASGPHGIADRPLAALSGGQFQRALLARAMLGRPELLMLDEPAQGLDQPGAAAFYRLVETLRHRSGAAVLMVSHDLHVVMSASDRVICLNGHVCCEGTPTVVRDLPAYRSLFGLGTGGALALYRHQHDHAHDNGCSHAHESAEEAGAPVAEPSVAPP